MYLHINEYSSMVRVLKYTRLPLELACVRVTNAPEHYLDDSNTTKHRKA